MKIALVCPASLPAIQFGGIMFLGVDIAREISKLGNDVTIYTTDLDFANNAKTFNKSLPRIEKHDGFKINRTHVWFSFRLFYVNLGMYYQLKNDRPEIIHTIGVRSFQSLVAAIISRKYKIPLVISDQGGLTTHPDTQHGRIGKLLYRLQMPLVKFVINQATKISVPNEYEKEIFLRFTDSRKIHIIRNGINLEQILSTKLVDFKTKYGIKNDYILFLGRFAKVKGVDVLLESWSKVVKEEKGRKLNLVMMGVDFGFESEMLRMIADLKISDSVIVIRKPSRDEVFSAYSECLFLVLPSRWELSPLTPLEGFAFKKTTISTTAHGIPYTITNGENAVLVEPDDPSDLADAILGLTGNESERNQYGEAGYAFVQEKCNSKAMAAATLKMYREILDRQ